MAHGRQILSLGSVNVDVQVRAARWPGPGETLPVTEFMMIGGGKAANVAFLASRLGAAATLLGSVGSDPLADVALRSLRGTTIELGGVRAVPGGATAVA